MKNLRLTHLALILMLVFAVLVGCAAPPPPLATQPPTVTPTAASPINIGGECVLESGFGDCHFVGADPDNIPIDVLIHVQRQLKPGRLTFKSLAATPKEKLPSPKPEWKIYRVFMGLTVTDANGKAVDHFDPAVTVTTIYTPAYLDKYKISPDLSNLFLLLWDGVSPDDKNGAWRRLPVVSRDPQKRSLTVLIGSFLDIDDMADGG